MKLEFSQVAGIFGRPHVEPGDTLIINDRLHVVTAVDADGVTFSEVEDGPDDEAGDGDEEE